MSILSQLIIAGLIMGILDFFWLGFIAKELYYREMGSLFREKPDMTAALLFYVIYVIGVTVFVINPAVQSGSLVSTLLQGALFGFVAYATYDLTNLATLKGFSKKIVVIDLVWGAALTAVVAVGTYVICRIVG